MKPTAPSLSSLLPFLILAPAIFCQQQTQQKPLPNNSYEQIFTVIIIIGGYVALIIGAVIFRLEARDFKVVQFEEVGARGSSNTQHKFEELQEEIDQSSSSAKKTPSLDYENAGGDSTKRKRRKRKADRLSDRRKNNESNQSNDQNQEPED